MSLGHGREIKSEGLTHQIRLEVPPFRLPANLSSAQPPSRLTPFRIAAFLFKALMSISGVLETKLPIVIKRNS